MASKQRISGLKNDKQKEDENDCLQSFLVGQKKRKQTVKNSKQVQVSSIQQYKEINRNLENQNKQLQANIDTLRQNLQQKQEQLMEVKKNYKDVQEKYSNQLKNVRTEKQYYAQFYQKYRKLKDDIEQLKLKNRTKIQQLKDQISYQSNLKQFQTQQKDIRVRQLQQQLKRYKANCQSNLQQYMATQELLDQISTQSTHINILDSKLIQKEEKTNAAMVQLKEKNRVLEEEISFNYGLLEQVEEELNKFIKNEEFLNKKWQQLKKQNEQLKQQRRAQVHLGIRQQLLNFVRLSKDTGLKQQLINLEKAIVQQVINNLKQTKQRQPKQQEKLKQLQHQLKQKNALLQIERINAQNTISQLQKLKLVQYKTSLELKNCIKQNKTLRQALSVQKSQKEGLKLQRLDKSSEKITQENTKIVYVQSRIMSFILKFKATHQVQLIKNIQQLNARTIKNVELLFKQDSYHLNFAPYLTKKINLLLILQIKQNGRICGAFCTTEANGNKSQTSFIFSYHDNQLKIFQRQKQRGKEGDTLKAYQFADNYLTFGNNEMMIKNNNESRIVKLQAASFSSKFYRIPNRNVVTGLNENEVKYQMLELHRVDFE